MKKFPFFRFALFLLPLWALLANASAENLPKRETLHSDILKEERTIEVLLPEKYKPGTEEKYDVVYVLDGEWNFKPAADVQQFAQGNELVPAVIMVAVHNTSRERDFLPTRMSQFPASGGADKFLAFFKHELIPHINKTYPASGSNVLYGHSFGGVLSMYALLTEPQLFDAYLAVDPSFWWDNHYLGKLAEQKLSTGALSRKSLYITGRDAEGLQQMGITPIEAILRNKAPKDLAWKIASYPDEHHGSIRLKSVYDALKFFYDGYSTQRIEFHPMNGIVLKDKPYTVYHFGQAQNVHYTTDGSVPTASAAKMQLENVLTNGAKITALSVSRNDRYNKPTTGEFKLGNALTPVKKPDSAKPGGLRYAYYEGEWDALPDFGKLKPVQTGTASQDFDINKLPRKNNFALLMEGLIEIQKEGYYVFILDSDDGSKLSVGNTLLIDHDGLHGDNHPKTYMVPLQKGYYPVRLEYFQKGGGAALKLEYVVPGEEKPRPVRIPFELQYGGQ